MLKKNTTENVIHFKTSMFAKKINLSAHNLAQIPKIPNALPFTDELDFSQNQIHSLKFFPAQTPRLKILRLNSNRLQSLEGLPTDLPCLEFLQLERNNIQSLESLPKMPKLKKIFLLGNPLRTLHGIPRNLLPVVVKNLRSIIYLDRTNSIPGRSQLQLSSYAITLIESSIHSRVYDNMQTNREIFDVSYDENMIDMIFDYFSKTTIELSTTYVKKELLDQNLIDRIIHEGGPKDRQILENNLPSNHPLLNKLNERLNLHVKSNFPVLL